MSNKQPGHFTEHGTRKFQANGPVAWTGTFRAAAGKERALGDGIRAALAYAAAHREGFLAWAKSHESAWERAPTTHVKPARRAKPAKPAKPARKAKPKQLELATEAKS